MIFFDIDDTLLDHEQAEENGALLFKNYYMELKELEDEVF